ncbi:MAG TPA: O-antigen ligase family protein [Thermoanaerobaculia bacterium]|nr:O-antigen ligase family protein [Thermoanaerobaculia bacterium]
MTRGERALAILTVAGLVIVPMIFLTGVYDYFRVIKEVAFRAEAILAVFLLGVAVAAGGTGRLRELLRDRAVMAVVAGAFLWSVITATLSTNKVQSAESMITVACSIALFIGVWFASRSMPVAVLLVLAPVALVNAVLVALQEYGVWNPFHFTLNEASRHLTATGFLGNPNDVGAYFALSMVMLLAVAPHLGGWQRWVAFAGSAAALAGVLVSQSRTAVIAAGVALFIFAMRKSLKAGLAILVLIFAGLIAASFFHIPAITRFIELPQHAARGDWNRLTSHRLVPFIVAVEMFRERPLAGWGPGTFKTHYMHQRLAVAEKYPAAFQQGATTMFGETHNDHLQLLAEAGIPACALFLAALIVIGHTRRSARSDGVRAIAGNALGLPLAAAVFVIALAFFPLQIALTRHLLLTAAALIVGWRAS